MARDGVAYRETYRQTPNRLVPVFWVVMGSLGIGLTLWLSNDSD